MATKSQHLFTGGKFTASHTSIIEIAMPPVRAAAGLDCVSKISLGLIKALGNGPLSMKFLDESAGCILAKVRGPRSIQEIRIYTTDKQAVQDTMHGAFGRG